MKPKIGAHVSTAGGVYNAIENAKKIGAESIQIYGASPRQWAAKMPKTDDIKKFKNAIKNSGVDSVFLHAAYLVNLASPDEVLRARSVQSLTSHLKIVEAIDAVGLIFHIGSSKDAPQNEGIQHIVNGAQEVLKKVPGKTRLILETSAGGGAKLGFTAKEVGEILKKIKSTRTGVCFDTAHAFEAGAIKYDPKTIKTIFDDWDKQLGLSQIIVIHANDSKTEFGSHNDRHENIGEGYIGLEGFKNLAKEKRLHDKPWILEVPGFDKSGPDKKNVDLLRSMF